MHKLCCNKGQGIIEATVAIPLLVATVAGMSLIIYRGLIYYFADYQLHEALVCVESFPTSVCKNELYKRIQPVLLGNLSTEVHISKSNSFTEGHISIDLLPKLLLEKKLRTKNRMK